MAEEEAETRVMQALAYLSSPVPEQQQRAEALIRDHAAESFEALEAALDDLHGVSRTRLLQILAATEHERRVPLCIDLLVSRDASRQSRLAAWAALQSVDAGRLFAVLETALAESEIEPFARMQLLALLGTISSPRAQSLAERLYNEAKPGSMEAFAAEDALLRSILASPLAQPAFSRYQERRPEAPRATLRELQQALDALAQPGAADRAIAESHLARVIGDDFRLLLALARSPLRERAAFALQRLKADVPHRMQSSAQTVLLHLLDTGRQTRALLALEVLIASRPNTPGQIEILRPYVGSRALSRVEAILESMTAGGDLSELRRQNERQTATLRPLLLLRGPMDAEVQSLSSELRSIRARLQVLEATWEGGWRREFEPSILGAGRE